MSKPVLELLHLKKSFDNNVVLSDISLQANRGDVLSILGPSGSGKSTLLRCINFLEIPDDGEIILDNIRINCSDDTMSNHATKFAQHLQNLRCKIGMVFQQFNLWQHLTVLDNMILAPMRVLKQSKPEAVAVAEDLLAKVGLSDKHSSYPGQLSGGQKQRVAIARALAMRPEIMLFDEPTSALDPEMVNEVLQVMQQLAQEHNVTMLVATHEMNFAREVSSQVVFMEHGVIVEQNTPELMFTAAKTERFRQFIERL